MDGASLNSKMNELSTIAVMVSRLNNQIQPEGVIYSIQVLCIGEKWILIILNFQQELF